MYKQSNSLLSGQYVCPIDLLVHFYVTVFFVVFFLFSLSLPPFTVLLFDQAAYDRMIDLRIATPQIIMNYALFLEELNYFEEAFKVSSLDLSRALILSNHCLFSTLVYY